MRVYRPITRTFASLRSRYRRTVRRNAAPSGYSVAGVRVVVKVGHLKLPAIIEKQVFSGPGSMFKLKLNKPVIFDQIANAMKKPNSQPLWDEFERLGCLKAVPPSAEEVRRMEGYNIEPRYYVTCLWARWGDITIPSQNLKKGQPIEVVAGSSRHVASIVDFPVRFVKWVKSRDGKRLPLVWFPEPMTYYDIKDIYAWDLVRPEHVTKHVYSLPMSQYRALYAAGLRLPPSRRRRIAGERFMEFYDPIPIKTMVDKFLRPFYLMKREKGHRAMVGDIWGTLLTMVVFHMAPIRLKNVVAIRPMREDLFYGLMVPAEAAFEGIQ